MDRCHPSTSSRVMVASVAAVPEVRREYGASGRNTAREKASFASPSTVACDCTCAVIPCCFTRSKSRAGKAGAETVPAASDSASPKTGLSAVTATKARFCPAPVWNSAPSRSIRSASSGPDIVAVPSGSRLAVSTARPARAAGSCSAPASRMSRAVTIGTAVCRTSTTRSPLARRNSSTGGSVYGVTGASPGCCATICGAGRGPGCASSGVDAARAAAAISPIFIDRFIGHPPCAARERRRAPRGCPPSSARGPAPAGRSP
jgi:hypothetical protein